MSTGAKHLHGDRPEYLSACKRLTRFPSACITRDKMNEKNKSVERVIGLDCHPDTFTAAALRGATPAAALVEKVFNRVPLKQLSDWARKHSSAQDLFVLEASGNSFQVARCLAALERSVTVLESCHLGQLKEAHANNDKISAVRIAKAYLAGTAKEVWIPELKTQERRDWFHAHRKATKRLTQVRNSLLSYLSDNGVRLKKGSRLTQPQVQEQLRQSRQWSARQWQVILIRLEDLHHADQQRQHWRSLIAQEVLQDPELLAIVRLCGVREMVAFALGAFVGDIKRFEHPKQLVKYVGLNPAFDDSGQSRWRGGIGGHGHQHLRTLLIEAAHAILRSSKTTLARWGKKLLRRKGQLNLVVAAIARKLTVAVWYLMMGRWTPLEEIDARLCLKVTKIIGQLGSEALKQLGKTRHALRQETYQSLKSGKTYVPTPTPQPAAAPTTTTPATVSYVLDPHKKFIPKAKDNTLAAEYGLR
jgi:transposase